MLTYNKLKIFGLYYTVHNFKFFWIIIQLYSTQKSNLTLKKLKCLLIISLNFSDVSDD